MNEESKVRHEDPGLPRRHPRAPFPDCHCHGAARACPSSAGWCLSPPMPRAGHCTPKSWSARTGVTADDPYSELGCLDAELFRAVRLVVDTGIHSKRWTRQQAIEYMEQHTAQAHRERGQRDRALHRHARTGLRLQDRRAQDARAARESQPGAGRQIRPAPVPQCDAARTAPCRSRCWSRWWRSIFRG